MQTVRGILIASVLLFAGGAQAFQMNVHTPTIHQLNPQPLPPGAAYGTGSGVGKVKLTDIASPKLNTFHNGTHIPMALHNGTHIQLDKHKDW
jgi:hypothetical protein